MSINADILYKIDSEIGKDKKVVELQREIERLNQELRGLNNCIIEFHSEFCNKQAEINRLNNIINRLEKELFEMYVDIGEWSEDYAKKRIEKIEDSSQECELIKDSDKE